MEDEINDGKGRREKKRGGGEREENETMQW